MSEIFRCYCNNDFDEIAFGEHFQNCKLFVEKFSSFDNKMKTFLLSHSETKEDLINIIFLLEKYIKVIKDKLKDLNNKIIIERNSNIIESNETKTSNINQFIARIPKNVITEYPIDSDNGLSYAYPILKSLSELDCIKNWYNNRIINNSSSLTNYFYQLLSNLYNNKNFDIKNIIDKLNKSYELKFDYNPEDFLSFFLELLHCENNIPIKENYNFSNIKIVEYNKNIEQIYKSYENCLKQTQNSIISKNFFNIIRSNIKCKTCQYSIFCLNIEKIFSFDLDKLPSRERNYNLEDCFQYYTENYKEDYVIKCKKCNEFNAFEYRKFLWNSEILIIYFKRISRNGSCDINFPIKFTLKENYFCTKSINEYYFNPNYTLKACISYSKQNKYFTYIYLDKNWYKFINSGSKITHKIITQNDIYEFEPQILIYEIDKYYIKNINNIINNDLQQRQQKKCLIDFNYIRQQYVDDPIIEVKFNLIPENEYKYCKVNINDKIANIIKKFLIKYKKTTDDYKLFIFNGKKLDINSIQTLKDIIIKDDMNNLMIFAIKGI